ncbi:HigA family addiction module antitoxin [Companilactobacillus huachuanensis]|uniref:HigA family addiction module antitoxin n=1 Tax=Companilactobacillus huachuanensis TaxID=2559914 RepID=A0ABW1RNQ6_9LACO|nr:HigA family addiction module antitoxin [Companilactobacillus huachuanensis]
MTKVVENERVIAFHPGIYVEDYMDEFNMNPSQLAKDIGVSTQTVLKMINGEKSFDNDLAEKLAEFTGISKQTWLNLQSNYDSKILEIQTKG